MTPSDGGDLETRSAVHVLVVDDEEDMRVFLRVVLEGQGYRVTEACDGVEALAAMTAERPDLVITDGAMPRMHGAQLIAAVRDDPELATVPLMLHWVGGDPRVTQATRLAADAALGKEASHDVLVATVRHLTASVRTQVYRSHEDIYAPLQVVGGHASFLESGALDQSDPELLERSRALLVTYAARLRGTVDAPLEAWISDLQEWRAKLSIESSVRQLDEAARAADYKQVLAIGAEIESALHAARPMRASGSEGATGANR